MKLAIPILGAPRCGVWSFRCHWIYSCTVWWTGKAIYFDQTLCHHLGLDLHCDGLSFSLSHLPRSSEPLSPPCSPLCLHSLAPELPLTIK